MEGTRRADLGWAAVLLLASGCVYGATQLDRLYGDGAALLAILAHAPHGGANWIHALHVPAARVLLQLSGSTSPSQTLLWLSSGGGAVMVAATFLLARRFGARVPEALLCCALLAVTPTVWFFSTVIEVHALHGAVVAAAALVAAALPWRHPRRDAWLAAAATLPIFASHQSGALLQPALALTALAAWQRVAGPASTRARAVAELAPPFAICLSIAIALGRAFGAEVSTIHAGGLAEFLWSVQHTPSLAEVFAMWGPTLALLWGVALAPLAERTTRERHGLVALAAFAPLFGFFTLLGVPERGAYAFGFLPFVTAIGARAITHMRVEPARRLLVLGLAVVAQALLARSAVRDFDDGSWGPRMAARGAHVRGLGSGEIFVVSFDPRGQIIEATNPEMREFDFLRPLTGAVESGLSHAAIAARFEDVVAPLLVVPDLTVVVDRGYARELATAPALAPVFDALEASMRRIAEVQSHPLGDHDFWVLSPPGPRD